MRLKTDHTLSVVIPVYNGGPDFERCLDALTASEFHEYQIVVVDDASTDGSFDVARARGVEVLGLVARRGPAAARNRGVAHARGSVILFLDADVVVRGDTLARVAAFFHARPGVAALFGSYDDAPAARNFVSQYKNLLHHFVHRRSSSEAETFWAGCGAVRREAFEAVGGFDERKYTRPSVEDIELGHRLRRAGFEIVLDRELQVKHLKRWTLASLLRTDVLSRALPWSKLILEDRRMVNDLNLRVRDRISAALVWLIVVLLVLSYFYTAFLFGALAASAFVFLLNLPFLCFLRRRRGSWFALRSFGMMALYYFYSAGAFAFCYALHTSRRARKFAKLRRADESGQANDA